MLAITKPESKAENCKKAIKAYEEILKISRKQGVPETDLKKFYSIAEADLKELLDIARKDKTKKKKTSYIT